ncbi:MAG: nucleotide exchange factor GrpE [Acidaminococcaceae bacterium]|nr:nucleotide exchange factor GrpE [Acidaminococcaceae bacterium]MBQ6743177.1 nucleotide exchange factor GrpE [Acidaminococcaceae bacterium]MBQ6913015.1 nucleotide exchange factor GrpE [Acidaminococcaceae bacterium]MBQ8700785.1 nucleotide exchange factor GrpE [Acidaminococcaceae bacterium]MBR4526463.1 nucleotide exchange factor GrpE [Acidaminococcaceae bacterium]
MQAGEETVTGSAPEGAETPGTGNGEGTAGNAAEEVKPEETAEETLEDVQAKLTATAALLKTKEEEATEIKNRLLRLQADFDNFRRRNTAEREELATYVTISVVNKFLQILDNFERAEAAAENATDVQSVVDGMAGIQKQFVKTLEDLGVKEIPAQGEKFNPNFHEAVMRGQNPEMEDETIDMVFEKGYQLHDKVVRHSKVRVISNE